MTKRRTFIEVDHSGDVAIEAWGETRERLFENATLGLLSLISSGSVGSTVERSIVVSSARPEDLLVDWLGEVIRNWSTHAEVYGSVRVDSVDEGGARGVVSGEPLDVDRHRLRFDVKAATYHDSLYETTGGEYHARVVFDL
jgi:SHS2 domain-containing protein